MIGTFTFISLLTVGSVGRSALVINTKLSPKPSSIESRRMKVITDQLSLRMNNQQNIWFKAGRYLTCVQSLKVLYDFNPSDTDIATNLGWMQENVKDGSAAVATYRRFRLQNPSNPDSSFPEGFYYYRLKQYQKEIALFELAIHKKKHPGPNTYRILAHTYDRLKRYEDSIRVYKAYIAWAGKDLAAIANLKRVEAKLAKSKSGS